jgi:hypothetical protein
MASDERYRLPQGRKEFDTLAALVVDMHLVPTRIGPIAGLYVDVLHGWRTLGGAVSSLEEMATPTSVPVEYCLRVGVVAVQLIARGRPDDALTLSSLLLAASERAYGRESEAWVQAAAAYVQATSARGAWPDSHAERATELAGLMVASARKLTDSGQLPSTLSAAGQMWHARALGGDPDRGDEALSRARELLEEAAALAPPEDTGHTHLALAEVLSWLHERASVAQEDVERAASSAMGSLDRDQQPLEWLRARQIAQALDPSQEPATLSLSDLLTVRDQAGEKAAHELLHAEAWSLADRGLRAQAAALLQSAWEPLHVRESNDEQTRLALLSIAVHTFDRGHSPCRDLSASEASVLFADCRSLPPAQQLAARVHIALHAPNTTDEAAWPVRAGLPMLQAGGASALRDALTFGVALSHAALADASPRVVPAVAFRLQVDGARLYATLNLRRFAYGALGSALVTLKGWAPGACAVGDTSTATETYRGLGLILDCCLHHAADLEAGLGDTFRDWLLQAGRVLAAPARISPVSTPMSMAAHSAAFKGALTTRLLRRPEPWEEGEDLREARRLIADLEALEPPAARSDATNEDLNEEIRRCAWLRAGERFSGDTPGHRRRNLQADYDEMLLRRVVADRPSEEFDVGEVTGSALVDRLGAGTALIDLFLGSDLAGGYTCYASLHSADIRAPFHVPLDLEESATYEDPSDPGRHVTVDGVGQVVAHVRHHTLELSGRRTVSREGKRLLEVAPAYTLPIPGNALRELQEHGYQHLVICPHGPLAFLPFHLLILDGSDLAEKWTVSTIPTLSTILPRRLASTRKPAKRLGLIASPNGGAAFGLPTESRLWEQVTSLEQLAPYAETLPLGAATPRSVIELLQRSRFAHIAAHGAAHEQVPAYHCLYLDRPVDGEEDGRLFAHQLLQADLSGVELLTLCACETAVGRADQAGNVRGLPLALLAAGVRTVVATLWPVAAEPALDFFATLYRELTGGAGKLAAFRAAQLGCRDRYPRLADWGAFTYIGDWR